MRNLTTAGGGCAMPPAAGLLIFLYESAYRPHTTKKIEPTAIHAAYFNSKFSTMPNGSYKNLMYARSCARTYQPASKTPLSVNGYKQILTDVLRKQGLSCLYAKYLINVNKNNNQII